MKLSDLIPTTEQLKQIQGVEKQLLQHKRTGIISSLSLAGLGAVLQIVQWISKEYDIRDVGISFWNFYKIILGKADAQYFQPDFGVMGLLIILLSIILYFIFKRTKLLLKESEEPFRYTFWIEPFKRAKEKEDKPFSIESGDRFHRDDKRLRNLLHHDLMERLNQRIGRFSLLEIKSTTPSGEKSDSKDRHYLSSQIHIEGHYTLRIGKNGEDRVVHVMPRVRIGPPDQSATLANPVVFVLNTGGTESDKPEMSTLQYDQIVERIYSSVASEIYRRIESDVKEKLKLFPTRYMRAAALYYEAEDFARSNTIDAYDHAIKLYRESKRYFDTTFSKGLAKCLINCRIPLLWRLKVRFFHMYAQVQIGFAKCLIYRRLISALSGRHQNPLFEARRPLKEVIQYLQELHFVICMRMRIYPFMKKEKLYSFMAFLTFPKDSWGRRWMRSPSESLFEKQKRILFEAHVVNALTHYELGAIQEAKKARDDAKAVAPQMSVRNALYLLTAGKIEPGLDKEILLFRQATEYAPDFQIAQYLLAYYAEMQFRRNNDISHARAESVLKEYDEVLKINPGNIASLAAQGYIHWLLGEFNKAKAKFEEGCEIKAVARETFIGTLNYGLARIAAEEGRFNDSYNLYTQAISVDPGIAACTTIASSRENSSYYDYITLEILKRFNRFKRRIEIICGGEEELFTIDSKYLIDLKKCEISTDLIRDFKKNGLPIPKNAKILTVELDRQWKIEDEDRTIILSSTQDKVKVYLKAKVSENTCQAVRSFVLNDYGNACLNYYFRFGDKEKLQEAIRVYDLAIEEYPQNTVAKYDLHFAYIHRGSDDDADKARKILEDAVDDIPTWHAAVNALVLSTVGDPKIRLIDKNINELNKRLQDLKDNLAKLHKQKQARPVHYEPPKRELITGKQERSEFTEKDEDIIEIYEREQATCNKEVGEREEEKEEREKDMEARGWQALKTMMENTKLTSLFEDLDIDLKGRGVNRLLKNEKKIYWERLDEIDVYALRTWAESIYENNYYKLGDKDIKKVKVAAETLEKSKLLFYHLLKEYVPENFDIHLTLFRVLESLSQFRDLKSEPLFYIESGKYKNDLLDLPISLKLRNVFEKHDILLSWNIRITKIDGRRWLMCDEGNLEKYFVKIEEGKIDILPLSEEEGRKPEFSIELEKYENDLKNLSISSNLRNVFKKHGFSLSQDINILKEDGERCLIIDQNNKNKYNIEKGKDQTKISGSAILTCIQMICSTIENWLYQDPIHYNALGWAKHFLDLDQQFHHQQKSCLLEPENRELQYQLADLFSKLGDRCHDEVLRYDLPHKFGDKIRDIAQMKTMEAIANYNIAILLDRENNKYLWKLATALTEILEEWYGKEVLENKWPVSTPTALEVAADLIPLVEGESESGLSSELEECIKKMRSHISGYFGVQIPGIRFRGNETDLSEGTYIILLEEIPLVSGNISVEKRFFTGQSTALEKLGISGEEASNPLTGDQAYWISENDWKALEDKDYELWDVIEYPIQHLQAVLQKNLAVFLGHQEVMNVLDREEIVINEQRMKPSERLTDLTRSLRALVNEEVPVLPFREVFSKIDDLCSKNEETVNIVEQVRSLPEIKPKLTQNRDYSFYKLGKNFSGLIEQSSANEASILVMEPEICQDALTAVRDQIESASKAPAILVKKPRIRPILRKLIELEFPDVPVFCEQELANKDLSSVAGEIELEDAKNSAPQDFGIYRAERALLIQEEESQVDMILEDYLDEDSDGLQKMTIKVFLHEDSIERQSIGDDQPIEEMFDEQRDGLFYELGIILPKVEIKSDNNLKINEFRFQLNDLPPITAVGLEPDEFLVNDTVDRLSLLNIKGREAINPANGVECAIVKEEDGNSKICLDAGLTTWDPAGFMVLSLASEIRKSAMHYLTKEIVIFNLNLLRKAFPALVDTAVRRFNPEMITEILGDLLEEENSIRDLRSILESLLSMTGTTNVDFNKYIVFFPNAENLCPVIGEKKPEDLDSTDYADFVRMSLRRYISHKYMRGGNTLVVYLMDPKIEARMSDSAKNPLSGKEKSRLIDAVRDEIGSLPPTAQVPVILTTYLVRKPLWRLINEDFPNLAVLSYQELSPDMNIQPIARITW
jgi:type III secretory pathway component EscV/tetratricopeptide (TPR) repeat protein